MLSVKILLSWTPVTLPTTYLLTTYRPPQMATWMFCPLPARINL